jgi:hypothetical protein
VGSNPTFAKGGSFMDWKMIIFLARSLLRGLVMLIAMVASLFFNIMGILITLAFIFGVGILSFAGGWPLAFFAIVVGGAFAIWAGKDRLKKVENWVIYGRKTTSKNV